ncbi:AraC family transcriptional regulator [Bartonella sp. LJL80]
MAILKADDAFNPDSFATPVIGIAAVLQRGHHAPMHQHKAAQLLYAPKGCMRVTFTDRWMILTPTQALLIPPDVPHQVSLSGSVDYRSIYFKPQLLNLSGHVKALRVKALMRALIERVAITSFKADLHPQGHLVGLLLEEIQASGTLLPAIDLPHDQRILDSLDAYKEHDNLPPLLLFAARCNLHAKTVSRMFLRETGLTYQQWAQQWRFIRAVEYLADGLSVHQTAMELDFASDSAFVSFFCRYSGFTPKQYQTNMHQP